MWRPGRTVTSPTGPHRLAGSSTMMPNFSVPGQTGSPTSMAETPCRSGSLAPRAQGTMSSRGFCASPLASAIQDRAEGSGQGPQFLGSLRLKAETKRLGIETKQLCRHAIRACGLGAGGLDAAMPGPEPWERLEVQLLAQHVQRRSFFATLCSLSSPAVPCVHFSCCLPLFRQE